MSYGCECNDEDHVGREHPEKTDGIIGVVRAWTGDAPVSCPWFAFRDPFVGRVIRAYPAWDKGQLATVEPEPSHRLIDGVLHYDHVHNRYTSKRIEADRKERDRARASQ